MPGWRKLLTWKLCAVIWLNSIMLSTRLPETSFFSLTKLSHFRSEIFFNWKSNLVKSTPKFTQFASFYYKRKSCPYTMPNVSVLPKTKNSSIFSTSTSNKLLMITNSTNNMISLSWKSKLYANRSSPHRLSIRDKILKTTKTHSVSLKET